MWGNIINKVVQKTLWIYDMTFTHFKQRQITVMRSDIQHYVPIPCQYSNP
jgi:hypothetical protein